MWQLPSARAGSSMGGVRTSGGNSVRSSSQTAGSTGRHEGSLLRGRSPARPLRDPWRESAILPHQIEHPGFAGPTGTPRLRVEVGELDEGRPLPSGPQSAAEQQFGYTFSSIRLHTDSRAAELADGLGARAFAFANHLVFAQDQYQPNSSMGRQLLHHELAHTLEQSPLGRVGHPKIQRQTQPTNLGQIADNFLQGITPVPSAQLRGLVVAALRENVRTSGNRPAEFNFILSAGVRIRLVSTSGASQSARYGAPTRVIEMGPTASVASLADAIQHAVTDVHADRTLPGAIQALPASGQRQVVTERVERDAIVTDMLRGMSPQPPRGTTRGRTSHGTTSVQVNFRERVLVAFRAFSLDQLRKMQASGVRFWRFAQGLPPGYDVSPCVITGAAACVLVPASDRANYRRIPRSNRTGSDLELAPAGGGDASYQPQFRMVYLNRPDNRLGWGKIRHELAHAWDDIRNDRGPAQKLDAMSVAQRRNFVRRTTVNRLRDQSLTTLRASNASRGRIAGQLGRVGRPIFHSGLSGSRRRPRIPEMYELYRTKIPLPRRRNAFDSSARQGHSLRSAQEFYAEGFNTFHGRNPDAQARLLLYAPELYDLLEREGRAAGRPLPSRSALQILIRANPRQFPPRRP